MVENEYLVALVEGAGETIHNTASFSASIAGDRRLDGGGPSGRA